MIRVQGGFTRPRLQRALWPTPPDGPVELDLSATTFIDPSGLTMLAAYADHLVRAGREVTFLRPVDVSVSNYMARMEVGNVLDTLGISHDLPNVNAVPHEDMLLELRPFGSEFDGEQLAQLVHDKVRNFVDPQVPDVLHTSICELAGNVHFHADVPHGYAAAQTFENNSYIQFAVADGGIGIQESLSAAHHPADAAEALQMAVDYGVSGTGEQGRGLGLPDVMASIVGLKGQFYILSGDARLEQSGSGPVRVNSLPVPFPGTLISGQLDCR